MVCLCALCVCAVCFALVPAGSKVSSLMSAVEEGLKDSGYSSTEEGLLLALQEKRVRGGTRGGGAAELALLCVRGGCGIALPKGFCAMVVLQLLGTGRERGPGGLIPTACNAAVCCCCCCCSKVMWMMMRMTGCSSGSRTLSSS